MVTSSRRLRIGARAASVTLIVCVGVLALGRAGADEERAYIRAPLEMAAEEPADSPEVIDMAKESGSEVEPEPEPEPATRAARKIMKLHEGILANMTQTKYQHRTVVRRRQGVYLWDCSGMAAWFLKRAAPKARAQLTRKRPVAVDFYRVIRKAPTKRSRNGWRRLAHIEDVRPGDLFAWKRPPDFPSRNTGHVGFALEKPKPFPAVPGAYTLRILDATSLPHDDDTREYEGEGGYGMGTILFTTDGEGHGTAYGWFGGRSRGVIVTPIVFGRVSR